MNVSVLIKSSKRAPAPGGVFLLSGRPPFRPFRGDGASLLSAASTQQCPLGLRPDARDLRRCAAARSDGGRGRAAVPAGLSRSRAAAGTGAASRPLRGSAGDVGALLGAGLRAAPCAVDLRAVSVGDAFTRCPACFPC